MISDWLKRLDVPTRFEQGLRVTDEASLDVVVGVLAGVVNKRLVKSLQALGVNAVGLTGADGGILRCRIADEALGFVGEIEIVDARMLVRSLLAGHGAGNRADRSAVRTAAGRRDQLLNINADTAAGAIAAALRRDVACLHDGRAGREGGRRRDASNWTQKRARRLMEAGVIEGGMIPKVEACLHAAAAGAEP